MKRIELIDLARLIAAVSVMFFHYFSKGIRGGKLTSLSVQPNVEIFAKYGYLGVEFFFIISGFVIACSYAGKTPGQFATSRALRLLPAYWVAVLFTTLTSWAWGAGELVVTLPQLAANALPFSSLWHQNPVDGVYWTLIYEILFYFAVLVVMLVGGRDRLSTCFLLWPWIMAALKLLGFSGVPFFSGYFVLFAAGAAFANRESWRPIVRLPTLALALWLSMDFNIANGLKRGASGAVNYDPFILGAITLAMFAFFLLLDLARARKYRIPGSRWAGGITYPLYLIHAHAGEMILSRFGNPAYPIVSTLLMMVVALVIAAIIHQLVERAPATFWKGLFNNAIGRPIDTVSCYLRALIFRRMKDGETKPLIT